MEKLSKETFLTIISHLDTRQKIKCVLVCKQWEQWIRNTILYQDLNLYTNDMFLKAIEIFTDNKNFCGQVQKLRMYDCHPDTYFTLALPEFFANLKKLIWVSIIPSKVKFPRKAIYIQQFQNWNALEDISFASREYDNNIAMYILESSVLTRLTKLEIRVGNSFSEQHEQPALFNQNLFACLQNAPALTELILGNISASLSDLNMIHVNTPSLQTLGLPGFFLDDLNAPVKYTMRSNLINFSVIFHHGKYKDMEEKNTTKTIKALLSHVATEYHVLQKLCIDFSVCLNPILVIGSLEGDVIRTIRKLPYLTSYVIRVCPITDMIMEAMDNTQIKLEEMTIWLQEFDARRQLNFLLNSEQIRSIARLTINDKTLLERPPSFNMVIFNLASNLSRLTALNLRTDSGSPTYSYSVLVKFIVQLNNLETLSIGNIYDDRSEVPITLSTYQPKKSKLNDLNLHLNCTKSRHCYTNDVFKFIFQFCPALKTFTLDGDLYFDYFGCLSLDLTHNIQLDEIDITFYDVAYYTFDKKEPRVMYACTGVKLEVPPPETVKDTFYIELLCNNRTSVRVTEANTDKPSDADMESD